MTTAISSARQIGLALSEFESTFGRLPDDTTPAEVESANPGTGIPMGSSSSNDYFRQLFVAGIASSESMFYAKTLGSRKPDNVMIGDKTLEKGECGFAYILDGTFKSNPARPIAVFPLVKGKLIFDYKLCKDYYRGRACILRADNSVTTITVDKSGRGIIGGKDVFDPSQPYWESKNPVVKWPE